MMADDSDFLLGTDVERRLAKPFALIRPRTPMTLRVSISWSFYTL